jgi:2-succinyl-6-hydroxy-2,4-cyclohexadiene-1-carboxylate synthase
MGFRVLLLHGFSGSPQSWEKVTEQLAPDVEASAPCLAGHTGHELIRGAWQQFPPPTLPWAESFEYEVDRLAQWTTHYGVAPCALVGYSLGARLALGLLKRHPQLFGKALLIGVHPGLQSDAERRDRLETEQRQLSLLEERGVAAFMDYWQEQPLFSSQRTLPLEQRERQAQIRRSHTLHGLSLSLRACSLSGMPNYWPELKTVSAETTLVVGAEDARFKGIAREMLEQMPKATLRVVENSGHNPVLESPQVLADLISAMGR